MKNTGKFLVFKRSSGTDDCESRGDTASAEAG